MGWPFKLPRNQHIPSVSTYSQCHIKNNHNFCKSQWLAILPLLLFIHMFQYPSCSLFWLLLLFLLHLAIFIRTLMSLGELAVQRFSTMASFLPSPLTKFLALASNPRINFSMESLICRLNLSQITPQALLLHTM